MEVEIREATVKSEKKIVAVQLPYDVYELLKEEAENDFVSISDVMRRIIIRHYRNAPTEGAERC